LLRVQNGVLGDGFGNTILACDAPYGKKVVIDVGNAAFDAFLVSGKMNGNDESQFEFE
jgi:hypothetical protein